MAEKIIFDTDPGVDDAMALLLALASPEIDVVGVTTVFGNVALEQTTRNALHVLEVGGRLDIPVVPGAAQALVRPMLPRKYFIHGHDGLGGVAPLGEMRAPADWDGGAAGFIAHTVLAQPGEISIVAVGTLTNLAHALQAEPALAGAVKRVIIMGGAVFCRGNASPVAEANIFHDPEAAREVFGAGWPVTLVGLDVTMQTIMSSAYLEELARAGRRATDFISRIVPAYQDAYRRRQTLDGIPTHDPSAMAYAIDASLFHTQRVPLYVEVEGRCAGQTVPDLFRQWSPLPEIEVCVDVDVSRLLALFSRPVDCLTRPAAAAMDYVTFGIILDEIAPAGGPVSAENLGGGGPQTAFGMRLWSEAGQVGLVARAGSDLPETAWRWLAESGIDTGGLEITDYPTLRARQVLDRDGRRVHRWQVPGEAIAAQLARSAASLPTAYRGARGWHLGVHPEEADLDFLRSLRELGGVVSVETFRPAQRPIEPAALTALLSAADIFSANTLAAASLVGESTPEELAARLVAAGAPVVALRRGEQGSLVAEGRSRRMAYIPALPVTVVDVVGAGNAYCGGFVTGWVETRDIVEAGLRGAAAASLLLEQTGVPVVTEPARAAARARVEQLRPGVRAFRLA